MKHSKLVLVAVVLGAAAVAGAKGRSCAKSAAIFPAPAKRRTRRYSSVLGKTARSRSRRSGKAESCTTAR